MQVRIEFMPRGGGCGSDLIGRVNRKDPTNASVGFKVQFAG